MKETKTFAIVVIIAIATLISCNTAINKKSQPVIGTRSSKIIEVDGLQFKDLSNDGQLDMYEDWRLTPEERSADLLSKMTLEQKAGFMLINTISMIGGTKATNEGLIASDFNEGAPQSRDMQAGGFGAQPREGAAAQQAPAPASAPEPAPGAGAAQVFAEMAGGTEGVTKFVTKYNNRHFIFRMNESARNTAEWTNKLQALCESQPLGIPAIIASNPRNNITSNPSIGTSVGTTVFSAWPGELGLSAMNDLELTRDFADIARQEWTAVGLRKGYMYMADLATEPRWSRVNGTFGENSEWVAKMITEIVLGFQGEKLSSSSVALTTKHFPGGGSGDDGQDSHYDWGKKEVYPGGMFDNNLIPFQAAIDAGTSSIMPYYSLPSGTGYEEVGFAFNKGVITDMLRNQMGFKGIINSDTGPLTGMPWGVESLTKEERYAKAIQAGVNLFSGESNPTMLLNVINSGLVDISYIDNSVLLLLKEKFELGLFENPYVDEDAAETIVNNADFKAKAELAMRKSIVLLENNSNTLPINAQTKVYFESYRKNARDTTSKPGIIYSVNDNSFPVVFVNSPEEADIILLWIIPAYGSFAGGAPVSLSLSKSNVDVDYINKLTALKPTILVMNYTNPWVINEIYNEKTEGNIKCVLATFGTTSEALLDVVTGKFNPTGKMPFSTPISDEAVVEQKEDVPGYMEVEGYALFNNNQGLSY